MSFLYNIGVYFYVAIIRISALFNTKAKLWIKGRKNILNIIKEKTKNKNNIVWVHCSSLGEFKQGKPIIISYKKKYPKHKILLTFFSSSGLEYSEASQITDWVFYLPSDTKKNAKKFVMNIKPIKVIFIKYDFWFNYISEIKKQNIPIYFVSCVFRKDQLFFKYNWFSKQLKNISYFFVQDKKSKNLLTKIGITNCLISGDTRFDNVILEAEKKVSLPLIKKFSQEKKIIVCGSIWKKDLSILKQLIKNNNNYKYIIAPHELNNIKTFKKELNGLLLSNANKNNITKYTVLIIDNIGILSQTYKFGNIAYIGGGFGNGIHNILEPAIFGNAIIFGPNHYKSNEALELINLNAAKSIVNYLELKNAVLYFKEFNTKISTNYIQSKSGATKKVITHI